MGKMISGVKLEPLKIISLEGGDVMHALKSTDDGYVGFGEAYFSNVNFGIIKGWKRHREMKMNLIVPLGDIRFVIYDDRGGSSTYGLYNDFILSRTSNYQRLVVPPGLWLAFQGASENSMLLNVASIPHDPTESDVKKLNEIEYKW